MSLEFGAKLNRIYIIMEKLYEDENYITYVAVDKTTEALLQITEYFPKDIAKRDSDGHVIIPLESIDIYEWSLSKFLRNAERVRNLMINRFLYVRGDFADMGTGYVVTDKIKCVSIKDYLRMREALEYDEVLDIWKPVLDAVSESTEKNIYFQISPENILVSTEGQLVFKYNYLTHYDNLRTVRDMAKFFYYLVTGNEFTGRSYLNPEDFSRNSKAVVMTINLCLSRKKEIKNFDELYSRMKLEPERPELKVKKGMRSSGERFHLTTAGAFFVLGFVIVIVFAVFAFFLAKNLGL